MANTHAHVCPRNLRDWHNAVDFAMLDIGSVIPHKWLTHMPMSFVCLQKLIDWFSGPVDFAMLDICSVDSTQWLTHMPMSHVCLKKLTDWVSTPVTFAMLDTPACGFHAIANTHAHVCPKKLGDWLNSSWLCHGGYLLCGLHTMAHADAHVSPKKLKKFKKDPI
jgi:hypothetical protein